VGVQKRSRRLQGGAGDCTRGVKIRAPAGQAGFCQGALLGAPSPSATPAIRQLLEEGRGLMRPHLALMTIGGASGTSGPELARRRRRAGRVPLGARVHGVLPIPWGVSGLELTPRPGKLVQLVLGHKPPPKIGDPPARFRGSELAAQLECSPVRDNEVILVRALPVLF